MTKVYTLIITSDESHEEIIKKMISSVGSPTIKIEVGKN